MTAPQRPASDENRLRILSATVRCLARDGPAVGMAAIAMEAGVSKALLHYHHRDRAHLLAAVAGGLAERLRRRERAAMDGVRGNVVDAYWRWLSGELARNEVRVLVELGSVREDVVRAACAAASQVRRAEAARSVERIFASLELTPKVPAIMLGDVMQAFMDGLALDVLDERDARASFDALWLALLGLAD